MNSIPSPASARIYVYMFRHFAAWMSERGLRMSSLSASDLATFLNQADGSSRRRNSAIRQRYVRLLQRCYDHLLHAPNPARSTLLDAAAHGAGLGTDEQKAALTPPQAAAFASALPPADAGWKQGRDRVMQLLMLYGGLKVAEVVGLRMQEVARQADLDGSLRLELTPQGKHPSSHPHHTRLETTAVPELLAWLRTRAQLPIPGELLFPANFRGAALDKSTVYRQVKATFDRAGLAPPRLGGRTLRNTFAVQELDQTSPAELTEQLGLALTRSIRPYAVAKKRLAQVAT